MTDKIAKEVDAVLAKLDDVINLAGVIDKQRNKMINPLWLVNEMHRIRAKVVAIETARLYEGATHATENRSGSDTGNAHP